MTEGGARRWDTSHTLPPLIQSEVVRGGEEGRAKSTEWRLTHPWRAQDTQGRRWGCQGDRHPSHPVRWPGAGKKVKFSSQPVSSLLQGEAAERAGGQKKAGIQPNTGTSLIQSEGPRGGEFNSGDTTIGCQQHSQRHRTYNFYVPPKGETRVLRRGCSSFCLSLLPTPWVASGVTPRAQ